MEECFSTATTAIFSSVLQSTTFSIIHHTQLGADSSQEEQTWEFWSTKASFAE